jgi:metal-responsive CopG/Arc/MetJ family transcriptional regulator
MKTVQMTIDDQLLLAVDQVASQFGETRSAFIRSALQTELKRRRNEALEAAHQKSFLELPDTDAWQPKARAWGDV